MRDGTQLRDDRVADGSDTTVESTRAVSRFGCEDLSISYRADESPVIEDTALQVPSGAVTALVGPNGSGKSTLLKGLAGQLSPDEGTVHLDGTNIQQLGTTELARKLGLLSQEHTVPDSSTVEQLVSHGRYPHGSMFSSLTDEDWRAIDRAIDLAGIEHLRDRQVGSLSGGQRQLAWIAMVLAQETEILLLDEPTTFLDLHHQLEILELIERLRDRREMTVLAVLHDIDQAVRLADHVVVLADGQIQACGTPETVITEDLLADVFDIEATVETTARGHRVTPLAPLRDRDHSK